MRGMQCNVEFGYQLSIYSRTEENNGRPAEARLIQGFRPYRKENTTLHHYRDKLGNAV
jgi:hypothetical protein